MINSDKISKICFGCEALGGVDWGRVNLSNIRDAISQALELGINFFDTAAVYGLGLSESRLSRALGNKRHEVCIATKGGLVWQSNMPSVKRAEISRDSSPESLITGVESSLKRLKIEQIPLYYVHWPDPNVEIRASFEILNKLRDNGKIGRIGCSNFTLAQVVAATEVAEISFVQLPLNLLGNQISQDFKLFLNNKKIGIIAYNVLANGLLAGKYNELSFFGSNDRRSRLPLFQGDRFIKTLNKVQEIKKLAYLEGLTCSQYSIIQILKQSNVTSAIVGIKNANQLQENWNAVKAGI